MADGWIAVEIAVYLVPVVTLLLGLLIGWLAQRSGFCSIGGFRDLLLFKQTRLFIGFLALIGGSFLGYLVFSMIIPSAFPSFPVVVESGFTALPGAPAVASIYSTLILAIIGGFGMGLLGVLLGGCPLRQLIMSMEGSVKSLFFFVGTLIGAITFHLIWSGPYLNWLVEIMNMIFPGA